VDGKQRKRQEEKMIREFFAPRMVLFFLAIFFVVEIVILAWLNANKLKKRRWLTNAKTPLIAAFIAALSCVCVACFIQLLN
jgi:hypothetical protein